MKKRLLTCALVMAFATAVCTAQQAQPKEIVAIDRQSVNVRESPAANAAVLHKAEKGTLLEVLSEKDGWYEVREAYTGRKAYVSASVTQKLPETPDVTYCVGAEQGDYTGGEEGFAYSVRNGQSETTKVFLFWGMDTNTLKADTIHALLATIYADTSGRMNTTEQYFKGECKGWYLVLTEETDYDGNVTGKLEAPIVVYPDAEGFGVYVDGVLYKDMSNPFAN